MNIGVDIDMSMVRSDIPWENYLDRHFPKIQDIPDREVEYNLGYYYGESPVGLTHMDFWQNNHLYDDLSPAPEVIEALKAFKEAGHNLGFISYTKSGHFSSKFRMLNRLPFLDFNNGDSFIATKEKGFLSGSVDVMIEDRNKFLNQFSDEVIKIKVQTRFKQDEPPRVAYDLVTNNWLEIKNFILDL